MDIVFELNEIEFEWDEEKYARNVRKHGITFEEAAEVFFDPESRFGDAAINSEHREYILGYSLMHRMLLVVFLERKMRMRIISARRATVEERKAYEER